MIKFSFFFFFKQKTAYEMRISDWSSDVCSSDLVGAEKVGAAGPGRIGDGHMFCAELDGDGIEIKLEIAADAHGAFQAAAEHPFEGMLERSEEHTSELQSLMRISYAVFCLKKKKIHDEHAIKSNKTRTRKDSKR